MTIAGVSAAPAQSARTSFVAAGCFGFAEVSSSGSDALGIADVYCNPSLPRPKFWFSMTRYQSGRSYPIPLGSYPRNMTSRIGYWWGPDAARARWGASSRVDACVLVQTSYGLGGACASANAPRVS
jgi:hypothetical protein